MAKKTKVLTFKWADGTIHSLKGYQEEKNKAGAKTFKSRYKAKQLPKKVDMRAKMTKVENQKSVCSCTANATAGAYEYLIKKNQGINYNASRLFLYYNARKADLEKGEKMSDNGSCISTTIEQMQKKGCCSERTWPYSEKESVVNKKPSTDAYDEAKQFKVKDAECIGDDLESWKATLAEGYPIIFGVALYDSFDRGRNGRIPDPSPDEVRRAEHGGHAMLCVGYSDVDKVFIVRNSWGETWGDHGYCYMSYNNVMTHQHAHWIIKTADEVEDNEDEWDDDEESLFVDFKDEFSKMSDEDWRDFNDDMGEYGFEYRVGALFLSAACADGDLSDEEVESAAVHLKNILKLFNIKQKPKKILRNCLALVIGQKDFNKDTVDIFESYLSREALINIYKQLWEVAKADEMADDEEYFITDIAEVWFKGEDQDTYLSLAYPDEYYDNDDLDLDFDYDDDDELIVELDEEFDNMDSKTSKAFDKAMGDYDFVERLAALFMVASSADLTLTDDELESAIDHIKDTLDTLGSERNARVIVHRGMAAAVGIEDFINDTVDIFANYLSVGARYNIYRQMLEVASADDDLNEDEKDRITDIGEQWFDDEDNSVQLQYPDDFFDD
ncbi:MAG: TerB family tellurite resistance protein [Bacteroidales bacterium]|nr:TerB family tellurite resistance protein [Bacteroidales bacterium]